MRVLVLSSAAALIVAALPGSASAQPGAAGAAGASHADVRGFDTCVAPSTGFMRSWLGSPYRAVNIYLRSSHIAADCRSQPELTPQWVKTVRTNRWALLPLYVGLQAPCRDDRSQDGFTAANARDKGRSAADTAVQRMQHLGLGRHNPIYLDVEPYDTKRRRCAAAVVDYVEAWTKRLHRLRYVAGVYAHATRGIEPIARSASPRPDDVWWALFNGDPSTSYPTLHGHWKGHRIHQYASEDLAHASTYNGQGPLQIDKDSVHADVVGLLPPGATTTYRASPPYDPKTQSFSSLNERPGPSTAGTPTGSYSYGDRLRISCQVTGETHYGDSVWDRLADGNYVFDLYTTTTGGLGFTQGLPRC